MQIFATFSYDLGRSQVGMTRSAFNVTNRAFYLGIPGKRDAYVATPKPGK